MFGFSPEQRGLIKDEYNMWKFGENHLDRLRKSLENVDPRLLDVNKH
jgi:hypothetical protein